MDNMQDWFQKGIRSKRDHWSYAVKIACCDHAKLHSYFFGYCASGWYIDTDHTDIDGVQFCPFCGKSLPSVEDLSKAYERLVELGYITFYKRISKAIELPHVQD